MDDDCYFGTNEALTRALTNSSYNKITVSSALYGTCYNCSEHSLPTDILDRSHVLSNGLCVLKERRAGETLASFFGARSSAPGLLLGWSIKKPEAVIRGDLCFARGSNIVAGYGLTHDWITTGEHVTLPTAAYHFRHMKLPPLKEYLQMVQANSFWGSVKPDTTDDPTLFWERLSAYVCKEAVSLKS